MTKKRQQKKEDVKETIRLNHRQEILQLMALNATTSRYDLLRKMMETGRDINAECGYPDTIDTTKYKELYDREGLATRTVSIFPEESWAVDPAILEKEDSDGSTEFEQAWKSLEKRFNLFHFLSRIDELSGIGPFGVLLLGFNDGQSLDKPLAIVEQAVLDPQKVVTTPLTLNYIRPFDASVITIDKVENNVANPRYGQPVLYSIEMNGGTGSTAEEGNTVSSTLKVHWTRVIHVADNRKVSEVYGIPRMQIVYNRLYDLRKILGGSGEMFWKGAFPGYVFEVNPDITADVELDKESLRAEFTNYSNSLQRYMALEGVTAKSLSPQVADPSRHVDTQVKAVAICLGIPYRIFLGSEEAKLASSEDTKRWNKRLAKRQNKYLTPLLVRPFVQRLITTGVLPTPSDDFIVQWPDLNEETNKQKAETLETKCRAFSQLVSAWMQGGPISMEDIHHLAEEYELSQTDLDTIKQELQDRGEEV